MSLDSPERAAARQAVADAIQAYAVLADLGDDQFLGDWAVVAHLPQIDDPGHAEYLLVFPSPYAPSHTALGLFTVATDIVGGGWQREDD